MGSFERQLLTALVIGFIVSQVFSQKASDSSAAVDSTQYWAGAGTDPFGVSYTVTEKAMRGGL